MDDDASRADAKRTWLHVAGYDLVLIDEARRSAQRAREAEVAGDSDLEAGSTCAAVLCAAAACEALLSEEVTNWDSPGLLDDPDPSAERVRKARGADGKWKTYLRSVRTAEHLVSTPEYEDLKCLFKLRNHIAHRGARWAHPGQWPDQLSKCITSRKMPIRAAVDADWTSVLLVSDVAEWAVRTARRWFEVTAWFTPHARAARGAMGRDPITLE